MVLLTRTERTAVGQRKVRVIINFLSRKMFTFGRTVVGEISGNERGITTMYSAVKDMCAAVVHVPFVYSKVRNRSTETLFTIHRVS